jgi:hypothetical protein
MWRRRASRNRIVTCIACDAQVPRSAAREYDKEGDRWERHDKEFEYLCKSCDRELCHQPRGDLEAMLTEIGAGQHSRTEFLRRYVRTVEERYGSSSSRKER